MQVKVCSVVIVQHQFHEKALHDFRINIQSIPEKLSKVMTTEVQKLCKEKLT